MRHFIYAMCVAIAVFAGTPAFAANESRAFPPDHCSTESPFMGFTGVSGSNTFCSSAQDIIKSAMPTCGAGQIVAHDGTKFYCKAEVSVPSCTPGTFLSFDGNNYTCQSTGVATCGNNQVLTFNGSSYFCVNKDASIPVCGANQFLTYNGSYQCAAVQAPAPLNVGCPAGYVLNGISNNQPVCTQQDNASARACGEPTNSWGYNTSGVGAGPWPEGSTISQFDGSGGGGCARYGVYKTCVNGQWIASGTWCDENTPPYSGGGG